MKSLIFTESSIDGIIKGIKRQTRRIIKPQPPDNSGDWTLSQLIETTNRKEARNEGKFRWVIIKDNRIVKKDTKYFSPRFKVGDICYIKEPFYFDIDGSITYCRYEMVYKYGAYCKLFPERIDDIKWSNPLFMPEKCARLFIEITGVRAENVCGISDEDCLKEGIYEREKWSLGKYYQYEWNGEMFQTPREAFAAQFNAINGKNAFENMVWVWVIDFKPLKQKP